MESTRRLEIVRKCVGNRRLCFLLIFLYLYAASLQFISLLYIYRAAFSDCGEEAGKLQHDIQTLIPKPSLVPSMWRDYHPFQNGSTYIPVNRIEEGMLISLIIFSPLDHHRSALVQMISSVLQLTCLQLWFVIKRLTKSQLICLLLATVFSILYVTAMDVPCMAIHSAVRDYFIVWIEGKIVEVDLSSDVQDEVLSHPFTQGESAPFFLSKLFRYHGEDVVMMCEYHVFGNSGVEPYSIKTWWRKNGAPIIETDRMYVNVSIEGISGEIPIDADNFQRYHIRSKLIIELFQPEDGGIYTCDYVNPMPQIVHVEPYAPENNPEYVTAKRSEPMSPNPSPNSGFHCQPKFNDQRMSKQPRPLTICFKEFELKVRAKETKTIRVSPGGILMSAATYRTVVMVDDIKVDVTTEEDIDDKDNYGCCSLFIKIYWQLFRFGGFIDLPVSRVLAHKDELRANQLAICKYKCICRHNSELQEFVFYRNYFNSTTTKHEEIQIQHPVSLFFQPEDGGSFPRFDTFSYCSSSESDLGVCWCLEKLFDFLYNFYIFDIVMAIAMIIILFIMRKFVTMSANWIAKPLRKFCLVSNSQHMLQFLTVNGPPQYLYSHDTTPSYNYDVYLSYSEDDEYDSEVAIHVKRLLENANLTVFDPVRDILPGRIVDYESAMSMQQSCLFVIIVSKTFTEDNIKKMEYLAIQDTIVRRDSEPKDCILIVQVDDCEYTGLHCVPCIRVPDGLKETFSLDHSSICKFCEWICTTVPMHRSKSTIGKIVSRLRASGFTVTSAILILLLMYLASKSSLLAQWREQLFAGLS